MSFAHLHCHSAYSLLEGTALPQALVAAARKLHMPALALTDLGNLYGAVHFYMAAQKAGVKPIIGMEVDLDDGSSLVLLARNMDGYRNLCHLSSLLRLNAAPEAFSPAGFGDDDEVLPWDTGMWGVPLFGFTARPTKLPSRSVPTTSPASMPSALGADLARIANSALKMSGSKLPGELLLSGRHTRGLVALSGGRRGLVNSLVSQGKTRAAARAAGMLLSAFGEGNFFIELTACREADRAAIPTLVSLASDLSIPLVATNDVLYLKQADLATACALASAGAKSRRLDGAYSPLEESAGSDKNGAAERRSCDLEGRHFSTPEEMAQLFKAYPQALANARFIAEQCTVELPLHRPLFPSVDLGRGKDESPFSRLWKLCFAGATRLYKPLDERVISRLKYELEVIEKLGFSPYFLIVWDIARFAARRGIPTMARGSAANSMVAYVLGITQVDPLAQDLLFERFLNPSRAEFELPDIDIDLCWRRRDEVLHYVYNKYGRDHVAIVGTHITFRLRSAWREMAKALGIPQERINRIAARLPHMAAEDTLKDSVPEDVLENESGVTIYGVEETMPADVVPAPVRLKDEREQRAFELCKAIEGLPRHAGMHCAGVVITPGPIADIVPLQRAARDPSMAVTQYEKDAIAALGLVKMDLLGSRALTTLVDAIQAAGLAKGNGDIHAGLAAIPFDDPATYRMLAQGDTLGCFQLESPGMRGLLKWLRPKSMDDMAAAISLFRPGPLEGGFLETFMRRHLGQEPVSYPHPSMEPILKSTYGVILYQEQFLRLAHTLAGLDLGAAEKLRKDIGKTRSSEERTRLGSLFVAGCIERGIDQLQSEKVWEVISGYTGFGFCQAHACSYALTAYRSAYMKAHYPAEYLAAQINNQGGYYGASVYVEDARRIGIELLPPHVNHSGAFCDAVTLDKRTRRIRFGLQFVKGLSERTITLILSERRSGGPFRSLQDLLLRVQMPLSEVVSLVKVGACDHLESGDWEMAVTGVTGNKFDAYKPTGLNRRQMLWLLPTLINTRKPQSRGALAPHNGSHIGPLQIVMDDFLVGHLVSPRILGNATSQLEVPTMEDFSPAEKLRLEQDVLGFTLTRNTMELYDGASSLQTVVPCSALAEYAGHKVTVAGVIVAGRRHLTKSGEWMLFISLQDTSGMMEVVLFPEVYKKHGALIANSGSGPYLASGTVQVAGKGRGIGVQPPAGLRPSDAVALKMHPVVIVDELSALD